MKLRISHILSFTFALAVTVPAIQTISVPDADAGPGSILSKSRQPGRRVNNVKETTKKPAKADDKKKKDSRSSSQASGQPRRTNSAPRPAATRTTTTRSSTTRHHAQPQGPARATGRTRPSNSSRPVTTTRHRPAPRRTTVRSSRYSRTEVHHHHHNESDSSRQVSTARRVDYDDSPSTIDAYFTLGLGMSGMAAGNAIQDSDGKNAALGGLDWNLGIGAKGSLFGAELGLHGGAYSLGSDSANNSQIDFTVIGLSLDLKLQPAFAFFEPYALIGVGGYALQDGQNQESSGGGAIRLGAGADFRINNFSIGARYLFTSYAFSNYASYRDLSAQTESIGINATFFF